MNLLDLTLPTPAENLACDEALLESAESGASGAVLRFWESSAHFVVVGYANQIATEVDVPACQAHRVPLLRRCSGGGTVVQGPGCLNYALVLPITTESPTQTITGANRFIMERNRAAIEAVLPPTSRHVQVQGHTDLTLDGLKFSGNSQRRRRRFLLFHGTLLVDFDLPFITSLLRRPSREPDYRAGRMHQDFLTNLKVERANLKLALARTWEANEPLKTTPAGLIQLLVTEKYATDAWNLKF